MILLPKPATPVLPEPSAPSDDQVLPPRADEARSFALSIIRDPTYRAQTLLAAQQRLLPPAVEITLMHYAYGKPATKIELSRPIDELRDLSNEELAARASKLAEDLQKTVGPRIVETTASAVQTK